MKAAYLVPMWVLTACVSSVNTVQETVDAKGIARLSVDSERGDVDIAGDDQRSEFRLLFESTGFGGGEAAASRREAQNSVGSSVDGTVLDVFTRSPASQSRVDLAIDLPARMDTDMELGNGNAFLSNLNGIHVVTANTVTGTRLLGDVDAYANEGPIDIEVWPYENGVIRIEAFSDVTLWLPYGLPYDMDVFVDPYFPYDIAELGYDQLVLGDTSIRAFTGDRSVRVEVYVTGGAFVLNSIDETRYPGLGAY